MADEPALKPNPARYTDDLVILIIILAYLAQGHLGILVPEGMLYAVMAYVFGREVPSKL